MFSLLSSGLFFVSSANRCNSIPAWVGVVLGRYDSSALGLVSGIDLFWPGYLFFRVSRQDCCSFTVSMPYFK